MFEINEQMTSPFARREGEAPPLNKLEVPKAYKGVNLLVYSNSALCYLKLIKIDG